jgi:hypothetical protein
MTPAKVAGGVDDVEIVRRQDALLRFQRLAEHRLGVGVAAGEDTAQARSVRAPSVSRLRRRAGARAGRPR